MAKAAVAFRSNEARYPFIGTTTLHNAYAEMMGQDAKDVMAVLPSEGMVQFSDTGAGPCRGMIFLPDLDIVYSIHPSQVYKINSAGTATFIGSMPGTDNVQLSRNQKATPQTIIQGVFGTRFIENDTVSPTFDADFPSNVVSADVSSDYGIYATLDRSFYISEINEAKDIPGDFDIFDQEAGKLIRVQDDNGELIGMRDRGMEWWRNTGNADFPFERLTTKSRGLLARNAVVKSNNTLMFPGDNNTIGRLNNYNYESISTHEVARLIESDPSPSTIFGFSYDRQGHQFACFTGTGWTRIYDSSTQVWHKRESYHQTTWRGRHSVSAFGKTLVGDALSGKIFYLDKDSYAEDGGTFVWKVISPPLHVFPNGGIVDAVHFDLATGYGSLTGQGSNPKVMLRTSVDGGTQFGNYRELELGITGNQHARVTARKLGKFGPKGIVFELSISDPVVRALAGCDVKIRPLKR